MRPLDARRGFTLVELLVVIAITGVLLGLLLSAVQKVREAAARTTCLNNLKQIALASHAYHDAQHALPPGVSYLAGKDPNPHMTWCARLLPYLEAEPLWRDSLRAYTKDSFFLDPAHANTRSVTLPVFLCSTDGRIRQSQPVGRGRTEVAFTSYLGVAGTDSIRADGLLFLDSHVRFTDVADGTSNTLLAGERPPSADLNFGWWYAGWGQAKDGAVDSCLGARETGRHPSLLVCPPDSGRFKPGRLSSQCDALHFWSLHNGGAHFAFSDGGVRFLAYSADSVLPALATRAGGEPTPAFD